LSSESICDQTFIEDLVPVFAPVFAPVFVPVVV